MHKTFLQCKETSNMDFCFHKIGDCVDINGSKIKDLWRTGKDARGESEMDIFLKRRDLPICTTYFICARKCIIRRGSVVQPSLIVSEDGSHPLTWMTHHRNWRRLNHPTKPNVLQAVLQRVKIMHIRLRNKITPLWTKFL